jgi:hypothetical protein
MFDNRKYVIIPYSVIDDVDFSQVLETSAETVRLSANDTLTFVKYEGDMPSSIEALDNRPQEFTHEEMLLILASAEWNPPMEELP